MQHVLILRCMYVCMYVCMYLCQSRLGPGAYQVTALAYGRACRIVTWFVPARVSRGYIVCARVAWLYGLRDAHTTRCTYHKSVPRSCENECCAIPRVAGFASFNAVAFLVIIIASISYYYCKL